MTRLRALYGHGVPDCLPVRQVVKEPLRTAGAYMMNRRGQREAASRFEERRSRENDAPRLRDRIPQLQSLRLELSEYRQGGSSPMGRHTRHIVVERAPALFIIPCGDHNCVDGGYDMTHAVLRKLSDSAASFEGEVECRGWANGSPCTRRLHLVAHAVYSPSAPRSDHEV